MGQGIDWLGIRRNRFSIETPPAEWPAGVQPISLEGLALIGVDADNQLYWDGKVIEIRRSLRLTWWQAALAIVTGLSTVSLAMFDCLRFFGMAP
jgi:hypothetical protein